jgi:tetratricopeptide (TPR) repeat protein
MIWRSLLYPRRAAARLGARLAGILAQSARARGDYTTAERLFRLALRTAEGVLGPGDAEVAAVLNNLGVLYKDQGRYDEAERLYQRARAILVAREEESLDLATLYHNLGGLEHARGRCARGEPLARRGLEIRERALGPGHPDVAADAAALAAILDGAGKREEAEALFRRSLGVFERVYGSQHYEIAVGLNNLAALHQAKGDTGEAEQLYQRALALKEKLLGTNHPDVATTVNNLAVLYASHARWSEAEPMYRRAVAIFEATLGPSHSKTVACRENYRALLRELKRRHDAPTDVAPPPDAVRRAV